MVIELPEACRTADRSVHGASGYYWQCAAATVSEVVPVIGELQ